MIEAYRQNSQFIVLLAVLYVIGVWFDPVIYVLFPLIFCLYGLKGHFMEMIIISVWLLILSDYVPVQGATYADLKFAKDLKPIIPLFLFGFYVRSRDEFPKIPRLFIRFVPFLIIALIALKYSINVGVGLRKYLSFILMYFTIPLYISYLHKNFGTFFWNTLFTFIIGMLTIGVLLGVAIPEIGILAGGRFKGILGNPNGLGIFLNLTFILWMVLREFKLTNFTRRENIFILFIIILSLFWSGSRNGLMSVFMFYMVYRMVKIHWSLAIIVVLIVIVFQDVIFAGFIELIQFFQLSSYFRVDSIEEGSGRKIAWVFGWIEVQKNFFIGGSFGHDENVFRPNYYWLERLGHNGGVHNSYLSLWFDSGIIGLILYFTGLLTNILKSLKRGYIGLAFFVSICFNITYESWIVGSLNPFTIMFLIILTIFVEQLNLDETIEVSKENIK